ncbi:MAG: right-handed parallel beta-helix repeat-containing protein [Nostoc sp.]|uniref:right-handed parallel beta-helix repeat-containing protein n=1 Tax=Nostoc sp. TaxID=1180 RepID=UPI002FF1AC2D
MSTFTVTNTNNSGAGSLRQAVLNANALSGKDIINFGGLFTDGLAHTISLTGSGLSITDDLIIVGTNPSKLTIKDDSADRVFDITSGVTSAINGLTITNTYNSYNGTPGGGGISNEGVLTLNNSVITGNIVYHNARDLDGNTIGAGGGIYNAGSLTVNYSTISNNSATDVFYESSYGGGIYSTGSLTVKCSNITGNTSGYEGGGIFSEQSLKTGINSNSIFVNYSTITNNSAAESGGGIFSVGGTVNYSTINNNSARGAGGGIYLLEGTMSHSTISGNFAPIGGGIFSVGGTVSYSTISDNSVYSDSDGIGGGIFSVGGTVSYSTISGNFAGNGGGIYAESNVIISHSTISGNSAHFGGGGIYAESNVIISHSTISGNQAHFGGGIYNNGILTVGNSTIRHNRAFGIELSSGAKESGEGGGIYNYSADYTTATLNYSTIACNFDTPEEDSNKFIKLDNLVGKFINIGSVVRV